MMWINRTARQSLIAILDRKKSILLLGPRQTGKTSLIRTLPHDRYINLMDSHVAARYRSDPQIFYKEMLFLVKNKPDACVILDEIQKVPALTDYCQLLIDNEKMQFIITGSSARKIRNLLPGRVVRKTLSGFHGKEVDFSQCELDKLLCNGSLPGIYALDNQKSIDEDLISYVGLYLEEEVRKEALVRNLSAFSQFLRLACIESGRIANFSKIAQDIGLSHNTIAEYYRILQDCMLVKRIEALSLAYTRRTLSKAPKFLIFDLGVRRIGAQEGVQPSQEHLGHLLEQFVGLELWNALEEERRLASLYYWRDHNGPEVDYVIKYEQNYIPIEVKLTSKPTEKDIKHLKLFKAEYEVQGNAYLIANIAYPMELEPGVIALPWHKVQDIFADHVFQGL